MWLSLVEHLVRDQGVAGSNPVIPTMNFKGLRLPGPWPLFIDSYPTEYFSIILPTIKPPSCSGMITPSAPEFRMAWA